MNISVIAMRHYVTAVTLMINSTIPDRYNYVHGLHDVAVCYTCCLLHVALA